MELASGPGPSDPSGTEGSSSATGGSSAGGGAPATAAPPNRYESQKRRDWNTFVQYLKNHKPPLTLGRCSGAHLIEFLKYLDQFGKTKVHVAGCPYFGHPNPPAPCACPLKQAWGSLDALIGRLRAAYEENGGRPESNPFGARALRIYLKEVREGQAKARGVPYEKKKRKRVKAAAAVAVVSSGGSQLVDVGGSSSSAAGGGEGTSVAAPTTTTTTGPHKAAEKEIAAEVLAPALASKPPSAPTQRLAKSPSVPTQGNGMPALKKGKEKVVEGSAPQSTGEPHVTRGGSGVHLSPVTEVSVASLIAGRRQFQNELESFKGYSPLVPTTNFEHFARMSGENLTRKVFHGGAQSNTIAFGTAKKVLGLETELKNTQATLFQKNKEAASLANELKESHAKIAALEVEVKEARALKEKVSALTQMNEDLGRQLKVKNEALNKANDATKAMEERIAKTAEVVKAEGERVMKTYILPEDHQKGSG